MASEIERLFVRLDADWSGLRAELTKAGALTDTASRKMADSFQKLNAPLRAITGLVGGLSGAAAALGLYGFSRLQQQTLDYASSIKEAAAQTGFGIESLQELRYAAIQLGLSEEQLDNALRRLTVEIGQTIEQGERGDSVFGRLGVQLTDTAGRARASELVFRDVVERLRAIEDPARRAATAYEIFGREAGPRFAQLISEGTAGLDEMAQKAREANAVLGIDLVDALANTKDQLAALDKQLQAETVRAFGSTAPLAIRWKNIQIETVQALRYASEGVAGYSQALDGTYVPAAGDATTKSQNLLDVLNELDERYGGRSSVLPPLLPPVDMPVPFRAPEDVPKPGSQLSEEEALAERRLEIERGTVAAHREIAAEIGEIREEQFAQDIDGMGENYKARLELASQHYRERERLDEELRRAEEQREQERFAAAKNAFGNLSALMAIESKKMFEIGKTAAIAETIMSTYEGAQKAFTALADIPIVGPVLGAAAAAAAIAGGLARVSAIQSTQFGSRSVSVGVGGNMSVNRAAGAGGTAGGSGGGGQVIYVKGLDPNALFDGRFMRNFVEGLNKATGDGLRIEVVS